MLGDAEVADTTGRVIERVHEGLPVHIIGVDAASSRIRSVYTPVGNDSFLLGSAVDVGEWT